MAYTQTSSLSSTEGRLLEVENRLAYWCMSAIQHFLFPFLSLFSLFCYSFPLFSFFLNACSCGGTRMVRDSPRGFYCDDATMHDEGPLYIVCRD